ncbi:MAG: AAA family ATPase [Alphaproteobacteria bacterium]|nr:AAA family ATPase [Alphaproteobacteria bacterium]
MTKELEFKAWLEQGGAQAEKGRSSRAYAIRTIERNLAALGMPYQDLDEAWEADRFEMLRARLGEIRLDARDGGQEYRILMPESENPLNRLSTWGSWLGQYGRFLAGDPPGAIKDADRIRQYVLEHYIEPVRHEGGDHVEVLVRDVNQALGLKEAWPNICQALGGRIFQGMAQVPEPERIGADQSSATVFRFDLRGQLINQLALEKLRKKFITLCPDFRSFVEPGAGWAKSEKAYKAAAIERVQSALAEDVTDEILGKDVFEILKTAAQDGPLVRWQTEDAIAKSAATLLAEFYAIIGQLVRSKQPPENALTTAHEALDALRRRGASSLTYGERINILSSALAMARPSAMAPLKITRINEVWEALTGEKLFVEAKANMATDYRRLADGFARLFEIMRDDWHWEPQDWLDIQGFLWIASDKAVAAAADEDKTDDESEPPEKPMSISPVNLILYGPPGTGKTFSTAAEAVRLCGEAVPEDRAELIVAYQRLLSAGRIEFVTFHQSMSYEDFVEGRQPTTGSEGGDGAESAGFRLETVQGIFRRIARRAETSRGSSSGSSSVSLDGRHVYKMSIGRWNFEEDARFFEEAILGGYTLLGWEDIDWSDERYSEPSQILETCRKEGTISDTVNAQSGQVLHVDYFRNRMKVGDIIVVSKGNGLFRAIGEVTGEYEYRPRSDTEMCHRRSVNWLWTDEAGVSVREIYQSNFMQQTIYRLKMDSINTLSLERYMNAGQSGEPKVPEPFVLIIDEINRANISQVFGELITLLESDKRLSEANELRVRLPYSGDEFGVPSNLHIVGTMNTADRSIALLDTALRRRFTFREMMPDPFILEEAAQKCGIDLPQLLSTINERIEYLYDREHQIGHAYFTACSSRADVDEVMRHKVIPLLAEYFFEDWAKVAAVLGDLTSQDGPINGSFLNRSTLKAPPGLEGGDAVPRFRWEVRSEDEGFEYGKLVGA